VARQGKFSIYKGALEMATTLTLIEAAEIFAAMDVTQLAAAAMQGHAENPAHTLSRMLDVQQRIQIELEYTDNADPDVTEALYNLASRFYAIDSGVMQTNVDPVTLPFDVSAADDGSWVSAWVWVPAYELEGELSRIKSERDKAAQAAADLEEQDVALFGERGVDVVKGDGN